MAVPPGLALQGLRAVPGAGPGDARPGDPLPARTLGDAGWPDDPGAAAGRDRRPFRAGTAPLRADAIPSGAGDGAAAGGAIARLRPRDLQAAGRAPADRRPGRFLDEARDVLRAGLETAAWVTVDDTGARHKAANGFCTQIGNEHFTWFGTTGIEEPAQLPRIAARRPRRLRDQRRGLRPTCASMRWPDR